jgi:hypothetical protein
MLEGILRKIWERIIGGQCKYSGSHYCPNIVNKYCKSRFRLRKTCECYSEAREKEEFDELLKGLNLPDLSRNDRVKGVFTGRNAGDNREYWGITKKEVKRYKEREKSL